MKNFKTWLEETHPDFKIDEGIWRGIKKAALPAALAAGSLLGPFTPHTMDPTRDTKKASASYASFMDPVAKANYEKDLERVKQGLMPLDRGSGEERTVGGKDYIKTTDGESEFPGSQNIVFGQGKKSGAELFYPGGFGQEKSDVVRATGWRHPFIGTKRDVEKQQRAHALRQMQLKHKKEFPGVDFEKMQHADVMDFELTPEK